MSKIEINNVYKIFGSNPKSVLPMVKDGATKDEILEATQMFMASNAPRAAMAMVGGIVDPTELGIRDKMSAAKDLLDRAGLVKTEKMQVESTGGVMLLPPKNDTEEDE